MADKLTLEQMCGFIKAAHYDMTIRNVNGGWECHISQFGYFPAKTFAHAVRKAYRAVCEELDALDTEVDTLKH